MQPLLSLAVQMMTFREQKRRRQSSKQHLAHLNLCNGRQTSEVSVIGGGGDLADVSNQTPFQSSKQPLWSTMKDIISPAKSSISSQMQLQRVTDGNGAVPPCSGGVFTMWLFSE